MSVLLAVVSAFAAVTAISHFYGKSALALGKVSAMVSATAVVADAWSKVQAISRRLKDNPTAVDLPSTSPEPSPSREVVRSSRQELEDFYNEHPSMAPTGGLRGFDAFRRP